ncbi:hypothetical protein C9374_009030 [Naegleria lovaniensis]|uniref:DDE Tnp4 domain-containing protein n=1 Tax=Naegleria lovaniensis TaxID=51637 RepID=A0AA88GDQ1_NAELO|nr:uncharacterized protein C9374_009030 [Naegleria lovaniensis]KAG2377514.1 hypothetical protein C9374_009030 [Naegleria lovaniensis]
MLPNTLHVVITYLMMAATVIITHPELIDYPGVNSHINVNSFISKLNNLQQELLMYKACSWDEKYLKRLQLLACSLIPPVMPLPPEEPYYTSKKFRTKTPFCGQGRSQYRKPKSKVEGVDNYGKWDDDKLMDFTHLTRAEFEEMYSRIKLELLKPRRYYDLRRNINTKREYRYSKLTPKNTLLLICVWMGSYSKFALLSEMFGVSKGYVCMEIKHIIPILLSAYMNEVVMPGHLTVLQGSSNIDRLVIGALDATHFRISKPSVDQAIYYRGDKCIHSFIGQALVDLQGRFLHFTVGFPGSKNDKDVLFFSNIQKYLQGVMVLADGGYQAKTFKHGVELVLPTSTIIRSKPDLFVQHKSERMIVEMTFGYVKRLSATATRWRQRKSLLPYVAMVAVLCSNAILKSNPLVKTMPNTLFKFQ